LFSLLVPIATDALERKRCGSSDLSDVKKIKTEQQEHYSLGAGFFPQHSMLHFTEQKSSYAAIMLVWWSFLMTTLY
jgi:hypothetical protein